MSNISTGEKLIALIDDIELISKYVSVISFKHLCFLKLCFENGCYLTSIIEPLVFTFYCLCIFCCVFDFINLIISAYFVFREILENTIAMKHQKMAGGEQVQLTELLVNKDNELKASLERAREQAKVELKMDALRNEVERQDCHIRNLQRQLKEAEQILVCALLKS